LDSLPLPSSRSLGRWTSRFLGVAVVGGAIAVLVIGFLTALVGSALQVFIRWRRRKRLPHAV
jgi:fucose permease